MLSFLNNLYAQYPSLAYEFSFKGIDGEKIHLGIDFFRMLY